MARQPSAGKIAINGPAVTVNAPAGNTNEPVTLSFSLTYPRVVTMSAFQGKANQVAEVGVTLPAGPGSSRQRDLHG